MCLDLLEQKTQVVQIQLHDVGRQSLGHLTMHGFAPVIDNWHSEQSKCYAYRKTQYLLLSETLGIYLSNEKFILPIG